MAIITENEIDYLLNSFSERVPYPIYLEINKELSIAKKLKKSDIESSIRTYPDKLKALKEVKNESNFVEVFEKMAEVYKENVFYGSKYIQYFKLSESVFQYIYNYSKVFPLMSNSLCHLFPYMADSETLKNYNTNEIYLASKEEDENNFVLYFTNVVNIVERKTIDISEIFNDSLKETYTEFYGIKKYLKQFVYIVFFNKKRNIIEIRVDYFDGFSDQKIKKIFSDFFSAFKRKVDLSLRAEFDRSKLNIHSVIQDINEDMSGRLVELSFSTKEGSNHRIKKRRADSDIRKEAYHQAGCEAVSNNLDIYRIGTVWKNEKEKEIELLIPGGSNLVHSTTKIINEAIITKCKVATDFNFVNNKIYQFLFNNAV